MKCATKYIIIIVKTYNCKETILFKNKNMLRTLEPQNRVKNKNAEAHFKNPCSYKMKSVYLFSHLFLC